MATRRQPAALNSHTPRHGPSELANQLIESSVDGILAVDVSGCCTVWNPLLERLTGYARGEVIGKSVLETLPCLESEDHRRGLGAALAGETGVVAGAVCEFPRTGRRGFFDVHYSPLRDLEGAITGAVAIVREVTRRHRALAELRESREQFRVLFEEAPVAYHEIDAEGIVRRVNRADCDLLGFEPEQMLGHHISEFVSPDNREVSRDAVRRKIAGEQPLVPFRREFTRSDGRRLLVEIHENLIRDPEGRGAGIRSALLDVSAVQRAQEELENRVRQRTDALQREVAERRAAEQRLALQYAAATILAEASPVETAVNRVLEAVCRYLRWDFAGWWALDNQTGQVLSHGEVACEAAPQPRETDERPAFVPAIWSDRQPRWIAGAEAPFGAACGVAFPVLAGEECPRVIAILCRRPQEADTALLKTAAALGRQIGQFMVRRSTEDALERSEARFAAFMDHLPGLAFLKDLEGRYVYFNGGAGPLAGVDSGRFLGKTEDEIWPAPVAAVCMENDRQALESGKAFESIELMPHDGGTRCWLIYRFPITGPDGATTFLGGIGLDITERRQLEDQLRHSQKMEAVGRLAGGVAHDFNNLLTIIGGYGRMVLDQLPPADRHRGSLEMVLNAADRAAVLTSQLLAFSRRQVVQPKVLQLNHVVSNLEKMLRRVIGEHIALKTALDPNLDMVKVDPGQMEQVIMNLAVNARDAMPKGGTLTIETANTGGRLVRLSVVDTGVGIDTETRSHLFEPFFTTKQRGKGTGLGLSTVYGIVKQHGGEIRVESEPGAGARFDILLPAVDEREDRAASVPAPRARTRGSETVLLVEDEAGVRQLARDVLRASGYRVIEAGGGPEALRLVEGESGRIDLLLTDMIMPLMSGRELAGRVLAARPGTRVIYMSGYTDDVIAYHGDLGPEADFIQKPFGTEVLTRKVREVLDRRARERPAARAPGAGGQGPGAREV